MDASLESMRESYRQIDLTFNAVPDQAEFQIPGVERLSIRGHQIRILVNGNIESVIARARDYYPSSVEVSPIGLREIFLDRVKEN